MEEHSTDNLKKIFTYFGIWYMFDILVTYGFSRKTMNS